MTTAITYHTVLPHRSSGQVYLRRRLLVGVVFVAVVVALWLGAGNVLANRGGAPASAAAVRPASVYVVHSGDTLWSIARAHHGNVAIDSYIDLLEHANGGTRLQIGQQLALP